MTRIARAVWLISLIASPQVSFGSPQASPTSALRSNMTGKKQRAMMNCPSTVPGAETVLIERKDGFEVRITASDPSAVDAIRARAHVQAAIVGNIGELQHTGTGTGGGVVGYCPIVHSGTRVTAHDLAGGARVIMRPTDGTQAEVLGEVLRTRILALELRRAPGS